VFINQIQRCSWQKKTLVRHFTFLIALLICLIVFTGSAWGGTLSSPKIPRQVTKGGVGVKLGVINTGIFKAGHKRLDPMASVSFGVFFNIPFVSRIMISPAFDLHNIHIYALQELMADFSLAVKPVIYKQNTKLAIRPTLAFGLGRMATWDVIEDETTYLSVKAYLELAFFSYAKYAWLLEVGYTAFPVGGNRNLDASIEPSLTVRVGLEY